MQAHGHKHSENPVASDSELVHQALSGEQEAFEALVSRYTKSLLGLIYHYVGEYHEAHDILQQVWLQLYLSLATLRQYTHIRPWLFTVARNRSFDMLRHKRLLSFTDIEVGDEEYEAASLETIPDASPTPEEIVEYHDVQQEIQRAILSLPHTYRSVVLLNYKEQLTFSEIGRVLHMSGSAVKTRFHRAKPLLRDLLSARWPEAIARDQNETDF